MKSGIQLLHMVRPAFLGPFGRSYAERSKCGWFGRLSHLRDGMEGYLEAYHTLTGTITMDSVKVSLKEIGGSIDD